MNNKISKFTDLEVWKEAHKMVLMVYKVSKHFPEIEKFCLSSQLRRSSVSVTSNIAEGFARPSYRDKLKFYYIAVGSLVESQNQLIIARDLGYIESLKFKEISKQTVVVHKMLNAFITKTKTFI
jgi:four helix bundle protein